MELLVLAHWSNESHGHPKWLILVIWSTISWKHNPFWMICGSLDQCARLGNDIPIQDASSDVICSNSSGLFATLLPVSAGIAMVGNATAKPKSNRMKFFAVLAKIYSECNQLNELHFSYQCFIFNFTYLRQNGSKWAGLIRAGNFENSKTFPVGTKKINVWLFRRMWFRI